MNVFNTNQGMQRRSFHVVDSLFVYAIDASTAKLTKSGDAVTNGRFASLSGKNGSKQFLTKDKYVVVEVSQNGYKQPTYNSRFVVELGGDYITRIKSFTGNLFPSNDELFFEAIGKPISADEVIRLGLDFVFNTTRTPPIEIEKAIVTITPTKASLSRGIAILKQE